MSEVKLNNYTIGRGKPPFIVAEAGINHNGEIEKAFKMIQLAKEAGVNAIKFQTFKAEEFIADDKQMFTYKSQGKEITESMLEMFKRYEFSRDEWFKIKKKCDEEKILFLSTPQNRTDLDLLLELGIPAIKIGSDDFTNIPLLKDYSSTGLPIILSCGMSNLAEVHESIDAIGTLDGYPTILLLTTSQYPTPPEDVNLRKIETLSKVFPTIPIGFSDHTEGHLASSLAMALGAVFFEKHFTLDHNLQGPDHWFSEDPIGLKEWINSIRKSFTMMGSNIIRATPYEQKMKVLARRSIVALRDIMEGDTLNNENIGLRRPGNGMPPSMLEQILGMKSTKKISKGSLLRLGDFK
jgi:sialic acid synthase SpsE